MEALARPKLNYQGINGTYVVLAPMCVKCIQVSPNFGNCKQSVCVIIVCLLYKHCSCCQYAHYRLPWHNFPTNPVSTILFNLKLFQTLYQPHRTLHRLAHTDLSQNKYPAPPLQYLGVKTDVPGFTDTNLPYVIHRSENFQYHTFSLM